MNKRALLVLGGIALLALGVLLWPRESGNNKDENVPARDAKAVARTAQTLGEAPLPAQLSGRVIDAEGQALAGATVQLIPGEKQELSAHDALVRTAEDGRFALDDLPPGAYLLSATAAGFVPEHQSLQLEAGEARKDLELRLESGGSKLSGQVQDLTGGTVAAAIVHLTPLGALGEQRESSVGAQTDSEGRYQLNVLPGRYLAWAYHADYVPRSELLEIGDGPQELDFALAPGAVVEGIVREAGTGEPVAGARVSYATERESAFAFFANSRGRGRVTSDAQGRFRIRGLHSGSLRLSARGAGGATSEPTRVALGIAEQRSDVELFLSAAFRVSGRVIDAASKAGVPDMQVQAQSEGGGIPSVAASDEEGRFVIEGLTAGRYRLSAEGGAYLQQMFQSAIKVEADLEGAVIEVEKGAMILGRVEPPSVAEIRVDLSALRGFSANALQRSSSDAEGRFRIGPFSPGAVALVAESREGALGSAELTLPPEGVQDLVIELLPGASVSGRVVDAVGDPVGDARISLRKDSGEGRQMSIVLNGRDMLAKSARTSPDGSFRVTGLSEGAYQLRVLDPQSQPLAWAQAKSEAAALEPLSLSLAKQEQREGLRLAVEARNASITGVVLGPDNRPAPDVWVSARASSAAGLFAGAPPMPAPQASAGEEPDEREGGVRMEMRMVMSEDSVGAGAGDEGGAPGLDLGSGAELPPVLSNARGEFSITGLRAGRYDLRAEGMRGAARAFVKGAETGEEVSIALQTLTRIEGLARLGGAPVGDFVVELSGLTNRRKRVLDSEGKFALHRIDPGRYTLSVRSASGEGHSEVEVRAGQATKVEVELESLTQVKGQLVDEGGAPMAGVLVVAAPLSPGGGMAIMVDEDTEPTDAEGRFAIGLRPGSYMLMALRPGAGPVAQQALEIEGGAATLDLGQIAGSSEGLPMPGMPAGTDEDSEP